MIAIDYGTQKKEINLSRDIICENTINEVAGNHDINTEEDIHDCEDEKDDETLKAEQCAKTEKQGEEKERQYSP